MSIKFHYPQPSFVEVDVGVEQLESLFNTGDVSATDVRCFYCRSPSCTWNLCLKVCAKRKIVQHGKQYQCGCCQYSIDKLDKEEMVPICVKSKWLEYVG